MTDFNEKDAIFLNRLISLLNGEVKIKSNADIDAEESYEALKWQLTNCFEQALKINALSDDFSLASFATEHINFPVARMKEQVDKPWLKDKLTIGLFGHFNTGKTTALNLILEENLPTDDDENTALAAYLINGKNKEMSIVTKSGQTLTLKGEDSKALDYAYGSRKFPFARIFDYIVKENNSKLLSKLTIIDTPGLEKSMEHSEPTFHALQSCNAVIWFININNSISNGDIAFIKDNIGERTLYVVLSFVDDCENPKNAIKVIKEKIDEAQINVNEYFQLGESRAIQSDFRTKITSCLYSAAENYEPYNPFTHIYSVICFLEDTILKFQQSATKEYNDLDKETDKLLEAYRSSRHTFVTEFNTCCKIMGNVIDTFNNRCSDAMFCGGASGAICNLLNSYNTSFRRMSTADDAIDVNKLVEFGNKTAQMSFYEYYSKQAAELMETIQKLKKLFN